MSAQGLQVFDKTTQTANIWLDEIMQDMGPDREVAWAILGAVLRSLRDRLTPDLAAHLGAQLPLIIRGDYYDQYRPSDLPEKIRSADEFLEKLEGELKFTRPVNVRDAFRCVWSVLTRHVDPGQMAKVADALPEEIRAIAAPSK